MRRGMLGGRRIAVKLLPVSDPQTAVEIGAFGMLRPGHPNVVATLDSVLSPDGKYIFLPMELCDEDLLVHSDCCGGLEEAAAKAILSSVLSGLAFLHSHGVYHLDIKPDNILMNDGTPKLADLGAAVTVGSSDSLTSVRPFKAGTLIYGCPESVAHTVPLSGSPSCATSPAASRASSVSAGEVQVASASQISASDSKASASRQPPLPSASPSFLPLPLSGALEMRLASMGIGWKPAHTAPRGVAVAKSASIRRPGGRPAAEVNPLEAADLWSLAVSMFVCITGYFPWRLAHRQDSHYRRWEDTFRVEGRVRGKDLVCVHEAVFGKGTARSQRGTPLSLAFLDLMRLMLHPDPTKRPSLTIVQAHPFFTAS